MVWGRSEWGRRRKLINETRSSSRLKVRWPFAVSAIAIGGFALWRLFTNNLEARTRAQLDAYLAGDIEELMSATTAPELRFTGLTKANLGALWKDIVQPRLALVTVLDDRQVRLLNSPVTQGIATVSVRYENGLVTTLSLPLYHTEAAGNRPVILDTLLSAWQIEVQARTQHLLTPRETFSGRLSCLLRDRSYLESLGLKGIYDGRTGFQSWEQMERNLKAYLAAPAPTR